jgi:hypothetical protein
MTDEMTGAATGGGPAGPELSSVQQLVALDAYGKALAPHVAQLRAQVKREMEAADDERKAAKLADGTKIGAVSYRKGAVTARVTDEAAALAWCLKEHPEQIMQAIRPAFLSHLLDAAKKEGFGFDATTGQILPWITVSQGEAGVTVTSTPEGKALAASLVEGFNRMIEGAKTDG